ncbi:MAG TPA: hypothetical protein VE338_06145 [Ktedonobacterales bacterium]|jgi:sugar phosphate permease|nr:hypothetical protein [Ktedonobacterales bacterium]
MRLSWKSWLWALYSVIVFGYLAWPLVRSLLADARRAIRSSRMPSVAEIIALADAPRSQESVRGHAQPQRYDTGI